MEQINKRKETDSKISEIKVSGSGKLRYRFSAKLFKLLFRLHIVNLLHFSASSISGSYKSFKYRLKVSPKTGLSDEGEELRSCQGTGLHTQRIR